MWTEGVRVIGGRRALATIAALLVVLAGGACDVHKTSPPLPPPSDFPRPAPTQAPDGKLPSPAYLHGSLLAVRTTYFVDSDHGFTLVAHCAEESRCETWLASTSDGGETWRGYQVADMPLGKGFAPSVDSMLVLSHTNVVTDKINSNIHNTRWYTDDSGIHWQRFPRHVSGTIDRIPLTASATATGNPPSIVHVTLADGTMKELTTIRGGIPSNNGLAVGADGSIWIADLLGDIHVSQDRGRTWAATSWPSLERYKGSLDLWTFTGTEAYLVDQFRYSVWRTNDHSQSWTSIPMPFARPSKMPSLSGAVQPTPDGGLLIKDPQTQHVYAVGPHSTKFERLRTPVAIGVRVGARIIRPTTDGGLEHSADGINWTRLPFQTYP